MGVVAGYTVTVLIAGTAALRSDWDALAKAAMQRSEASGGGGGAAARPCACSSEERAEACADGVVTGAAAPPIAAINDGHAEQMRAPLLVVGQG